MSTWRLYKMEEATLRTAVVIIIVSSSRSFLSHAFKVRHNGAVLFASFGARMETSKVDVLAWLHTSEESKLISEATGRIAFDPRTTEPALVIEDETGENPALLY